MNTKILRADQFQQLTGLSRNFALLYRPQRKKYVRRQKTEKSCIFCLAAQQKVSFKTLCLYQSAKSMVLLNKYPYNTGHLLILPKIHVSSLLDLPNEYYIDLFETIRLTHSIVTRIYQPQGLNLGLNEGAAAGAGLPAHLHFHLIPRWSGDLNFFPLISSSKVLIEELDYTYRKLKKSFNKPNRSK